MKLVILDRDGVINEDSDEFVKSPHEWQPIPRSLEGMARLYHAGYRLVVATNQSGIARGLFDFDALAAIHDKMQRLLGEFGGRTDGIFFCPHAPEDHCECRKPGIGLLRDIARRFQIDLSRVAVIGDKASDVQAARAGGGRPVLVRTGHGAELVDNDHGLLTGVPVFEDLGAAADAIVDGKVPGMLREPNPD